MKKVAEILMALAVIFQLTVPASGSEETKVHYEGSGDERYTITVPASLHPGQSGTVRVEGTWASNRMLKVSTNNSVTLTNSLDGKSKVLSVYFDTFLLYGNNESQVSTSQAIQIGNISNALFGDWSGIVYYSVSMVDSCEDVDSQVLPVMLGDVTDDADSSEDSKDEDTIFPEAVTVYTSSEFTVTAENRAVVGYTGSSGENLVIPAAFVGDGNNGTIAGKTYQVCAIGSGAFASCSNLKTVTVPQTVSSIGENAFSDCKNLVSITVYHPTGMVPGSPWGATGATIKLAGLAV